jgi:hypothetical protein
VEVFTDYLFVQLGLGDDLAGCVCVDNRAADGLCGNRGCIGKIILCPRKTSTDLVDTEEVSSITLSLALMAVLWRAR